jgi:hypothetical protein
MDLITWAMESYSPWKVVAFPISQFWDPLGSLQMCAWGEAHLSPQWGELVEAAEPPISLDLKSNLRNTESHKCWQGCD